MDIGVLKWSCVTGHCRRLGRARHVGSSWSLVHFAVVLWDGSTDIMSQALSP